MVVTLKHNTSTRRGLRRPNLPIVRKSIVSTTPHQEGVPAYSPSNAWYPVAIEFIL
jgi:hypothetical protein